MRNNRRWAVLSIILILALVAPVATTASQPAALAATGSVRVIVELADAPLAAYEGGVVGLAATASRGAKLDVKSPAAQAYLDYLGQRHTEFASTLTKAFPTAGVAQYLDESGASKALDYRIVFNGMAINVPAWDKATARTLLQMAGVKAVYPEREYQVNLDVSHDLMGSAGMWTAAGGQAGAGAGVKIAVLDTGIDPDHDFFDPTGFSYPLGFPKGDIRYTNEKVILARGYYRADDPPANPDPTDYHGHGTGTAGIAAGNMDTTAVISNAFGTVTQTVSGVAPAAQVMNYQLFYTAVSGSRSAWNAEIIAAIEDMVTDGADVSNNSWGGADNVNPAVDPIGIAFQNAVDAGVVVVKSAGNEGASYNSLGDAMPQDLIIVGGNDVGRRIGASASVIGPGTVPASVTNMLAIESDFGGPPLSGVVSGDYVYVGRTQPDNFDGCAAFDAATAAALDGNIALISRGACNFTVKVENAQAAGAVAAIVFNHNVGGLASVMGGGTDAVTIPSVMVGNNNGLDMVAWEAANVGTAAVEIDPALAYIPDAALPDTMYQSSSRGPDLAQEIGVDVIAPGQSVWTSYSDDGGWGTPSGTSFSGPFAAGAAAVLQAMHPTWDHAAIKSAMMSTAKNDGIYKDYPRTQLAGVLDMGAGRLQFDKMVDPGLVFDKPTLSFKQMAAGSSQEITVNATDVFSRTAADFTYTLAVSETGDVTTTANFTLSVSPASLTFGDDGDTDSFTVKMEIPAGATPGDYEGWVWLRHGGHQAHVPVWVRVRPEMTEEHVLLLDDDASAYGFEDYEAYYTGALDRMSYTYDVWPVDLYNYYYGRGFPTVAEMQAYDKIVWFTGDSYYPYLEIGAELQSRNDLLDVMQSGGAKVLATGQDLSGYYYAGNSADQYVIGLGMDTWVEQEDAYAPAAMASPNRAVAGTSAVPAFDSMLFDLGGLTVTPTLETSAGNQIYVDEIVPEGGLYGGRGFLRSLEPGTSGDGWVGILRSVGPTLENQGVLSGPDYRTAYLSFGLEGVNDATGYNTRQDLLQAIFNFFQDDLSVTLSGAGAPNDLTTLYAAVASSVNAQGVLFRWDFGDGSSVVETSRPYASHVYTAAGTYSAMVEVTDEYGNTATDSADVVIVAGGSSAPMVAQAQTFRGGELDYTIVLKNTGLAPINMAMTDCLPMYTDYVTHTVGTIAAPSSGTGTWSNSCLLWDGTLAADSTMMLELTVKVSDMAPAPGKIVNEVTFESYGTTRAADAAPVVFTKSVETAVWARNFLPLVLRSYAP